MLRIRLVEEAIVDRYPEQEMRCPVHLSIGQEATAIGFTHSLNRDNDFVVSNHRNHGHYLAFTGDYCGLLDELKGKKEGVSGGRGGSQVIFGKNFISNGVLGSTVSLSTGISFGKKKLKDGGVVVCFIGDGALCEGVVYESFNMASLWELPIIYVLELNHIAQSTNIHKILAGSIQDKFQAFGIETNYIKSTDVIELIEIGTKTINNVKKNCRPMAVIVEADRLCAHSKGDDDRSENEVKKWWKKEPLKYVETKISEDEMNQVKLSLEKRLKTIEKRVNDMEFGSIY